MIPTTVVDTIFRIPQALEANGKGTLELGDEVPMVDVYFQLDPEQRVLVTVDVRPHYIGTVLVETASRENPSRRLIDEIESRLQDFRGGNQEYRELDRVQLRIFLDSLTYQDASGLSSWPVSMPVEPEDVHFWTTMQDLHDALAALLSESVSAFQTLGLESQGFRSEAEANMASFLRLANRPSGGPKPERST